MDTMLKYSSALDIYLGLFHGGMLYILKSEERRFVWIFCLLISISALQIVFQLGPIPILGKIFAKGHGDTVQRPWTSNARYTMDVSPLNVTEM